MIVTFFRTCPEDLRLLVFVHLQNIFRAFPKVKKNNNHKALLEKRNEIKTSNHKMHIKEDIFKISCSYSNTGFVQPSDKVMFERECVYTPSLYLSLSITALFYQHQQKAQFIHRTAPYVANIRATILAHQQAHIEWLYVLTPSCKYTSTSFNESWMRDTICASSLVHTHRKSSPPYRKQTLFAYL